jgi:hypothetical protein
MPGKKKKAPSPPASLRSTGSMVMRSTGPAMSRPALGLASLPGVANNPYDQFKTGRESNYELQDYDDVMVGNGVGKQWGWRDKTLRGNHMMGYINGRIIYESSPIQA